ncbi:hypothetical protein [Cupriavidus pauculus]|uniref:hypothetical protein n=1 Tax=Cupriavidus pauculus TaxID=82633 RepID=UPI001D0C5F12|nr:hypothetical protein [Cupriavidus pauculus]
MANTKFSFTTAEGEVFTRKSARAYTHVVVGRHNNALERATILAEHARPRSYDKANYQFYVARAALQPGDTFVSTTGMGYEHVMTEKDVEDAKKNLRGATNFQEYLDALRDSRLAGLVQRHGEGDAGPEVVLQWSQSAANATKSIGQHSKFFTQVRVVAL